MGSAAAKESNGKWASGACEVKKVTKNENGCPKVSYQAVKKCKKRQKTQKSAKIEKVKSFEKEFVGGNDKTMSKNLV